MALNVPNTSNDGFLPYTSWNKLEARPRQADFSRVLRAEIHDPLWMLSRQLQMGEFKGSDTGSGIITKAVMEYSSIYAYSKKGKITQVKSYDMEQMPLEPMIEKIEYKFSIKERIRMGQIWKREITRLLPGNAAGIFGALTTETDFFINTVAPDNLSTPDDKVTKSQLFSLHKTASFMKAVAWKEETLDGDYLLKKSRNVSPFTAFDTALSGALTTLGISQLNFDTACNNYANWVVKMYNLDTQPDEGFWNREQLEYEMELYSDDLKRLTSENAHNGSLDWYSFEDNDTAGVTFPAVTSGPVLPVVKEMLMTDNRFAGMPSSRWWEFENGRVNFGKLEGDTTDMAKIMLAQFALVYQDDWFVIPYKIPVGSYSKVHGIVVTDVFGVKTYVANHTEEYNNTTGNFAYADDTWKDWSWMDVSRKDNVVNFKKPTGRMLLLPTLSGKLESDPFESVTFARDEISNIVWAIEKTVPDFLGRGADAQQVSVDYRNYLELLAPPPPPTPLTATDARLEYTLMNTVPEHWVPFIVKHIPASIREVRLQRASMPRFVGTLPTSLVRPRTDLLSFGLDKSPIEGYYINEEEVSRAGTCVETTFQRTRWYNGKTIMWVGRRRSTGRGQGSSGLVFDEIRDKPE